MSSNEVGYAAALDELHAILEELEAEDIDIDVLASKVERAAKLIQVCRGRIKSAEVRVREIVAGLEEDHGNPARNQAEADEADSSTRTNEENWF